MMTKEQYFRLDMTQIPKETDTINVSLALCSAFDQNNEYNFTHYRMLLIIRKYLNNKSGIFTTDDYFNTMKKQFGSTSKQSVLNKLTTCYNSNDIPFLEKYSPATWKANSDAKIMELMPAKFPKGKYSFRFKVAIPMDVLKLHREQYICYMKMCMDAKVANEHYEKMAKKLGSKLLPIWH